MNTLTKEEIIALFSDKEIIPDYILSEIDDIIQLRILMRKEVIDNGSAFCPICNHKTTRYKRSLNKGMYLFLFHLASKWHKGEWVHYDNVKREVTGKYQTNVTDYSKLTLFNLLETRDKENTDVGVKSGECRVSDYGWKFLRGKLSIPKYIYLVNGKIIKQSKEKVFFSDCQKKFKFKDIFDK